MRPADDPLFGPLNRLVNGCTLEYVTPSPHVGPSENSVLCTHNGCDYRTNNYWLLDQHFNSCHNHVCSSCGLQFLSRHVLESHIEAIHGSHFVKQMSKLVVHKWNTAVDGDLSLQAMLSKLKKEGCSCVNYTFRPGTSFPTHEHSEDKMDCIVSGQLEFEMFNEKVILGPGDRLEVPRNVPHSARVIGSEPLVFVDATRHG